MPISSERLNCIFNAAEKDKNPLAQAFVVGFSKLFPSGEDAVGDKAAALPHLLRAAAETETLSAIPEAIFLLSLIHPEEERKIEYLQAASALGFAESTINLAVIYLRGDAISRSKAFELLHLSHLSHNPVAKVMLGRMYESGIGVEQNSRIALKLYIEAEELGYKLATERIAKFEPTSTKSAMVLGDYFLAKGDVNKAAQCYVDAAQFHAQFAPVFGKSLADDIYHKLNNLPYEIIADRDLCFEIAELVFLARGDNSKAHCFLIRSAELEHPRAVATLEKMREINLHKLDAEVGLEAHEGKQVDVVVTKRQKELNYQSQLAIAGYFHRVIEDHNAAAMWYIGFCSKELDGRFSEVIAKGRACLDSISSDQITDLEVKFEVAIYYIETKTPGWQLKATILLLEAARSGIRLAQDTIISCVGALDEPDVRFMLGTYFKEIGDIDNAVKAYYSAKELGHVQAATAFEALPAEHAHYVVGAAYHGGDNQTVSDEHMIIAARVGNRLAMHHLVAVRATNVWMREQKITDEEVRGWAMTAASDPDFHLAHYTLGGIYLFGRFGLPVDADLAVASMERGLFALYPGLPGRLREGGREIMAHLTKESWVSFGKMLSSLAIGYIIQGQSDKAVEIYEIDAALDNGIGRSALAHYIIYTRTGNKEYLHKTQELIAVGMKKSDIACIILRTFFYGISTIEAEKSQAMVNIDQLRKILYSPNSDSSAACMRNFVYCAMRNRLGFLAVLDRAFPEICVDVMTKSGESIIYRRSEVQQFIDTAFNGVILKIKTALLGGQKSEGEEFVSLDTLRTKVFTTDAEKLKLFDFICRSQDNPRIFADLRATAILASAHEVASIISTIAYQTAWESAVAVEVVNRFQTYKDGRTKKPGADVLITQDLRKEAGIAKGREAQIPFYAIRSYLRKQKIILPDEKILEALRDTHEARLRVGADIGGAGSGGGGGGRG